MRGLVKLKRSVFFRCTSIPFFDEVISQQGVSHDPRKVQMLTDMLPPKKKITAVIPGYIK